MEWADDQILPTYTIRHIWSLLRRIFTLVSGLKAGFSVEPVTCMGVTSKCYDCKSTSPIAPKLHGLWSCTWMLRLKIAQQQLFKVLWVMYMKWIIWTAEMKSNEDWSSQFWTQLYAIALRSLKKFRTPTGFQPVTSRCTGIKVLLGTLLKG